MPNATLCAFRRVMYRPDQRGDRRLFHRRRFRAGAWRGYLGVEIWAHFSLEPLGSALHQTVEKGSRTFAIFRKTPVD